MIQERIEQRVRNIRLRYGDMLLLVSIGFFATGFLLSAVIFLSGVRLDDLMWHSHPLFWFGNGFTFMLCYVGERRYHLWS